MSERTGTETARREYEAAYDEVQRLERMDGAVPLGAMRWSLQAALRSARATLAEKRRALAALSHPQTPEETDR